MCGYGIRIRIRQIESLHVAIRNASAHKTHDQLTVMLIYGVSPQVSRGRALKSFRMLLDRRRPLVNELRIKQLYMSGGVAVWSSATNGVMTCQLSLCLLV